MNLREELNKLDHKCLNEDREFYDLVSLYDAVNLSDEEKAELAKRLQGEDAEVVYDLLYKKFDKNLYPMEDDLEEDYNDGKYYVTFYEENEEGGPEEGGWVSYGWVAKKSKEFPNRREAEMYFNSIKRDEYVVEEGNDVFTTYDRVKVALENEDERGELHSPAKSWAASELGVEDEKPKFDAQGNAIYNYEHSYHESLKEVQHTLDVDNIKSKNKKLYHCDDCGYEVELTDNEYTGMCPACHEHHGFYAVEESLNEEDEQEPYTYDQVEKDLRSITHNFTDESGTVECQYEEEMKHAISILDDYYGKVDTRKRGSWYQVTFGDKKFEESLTEDLDLHISIEQLYKMCDSELGKERLGKILNSKHGVYDFEHLVNDMYPNGISLDSLFDLIENDWEIVEDEVELED